MIKRGNAVRVSGPSAWRGMRGVAVSGPYIPPLGSYNKVVDVKFSPDIIEPIQIDLLVVINGPFEEAFKTHSFQAINKRYVTEWSYTEVDTAEASKLQLTALVYDRQSCQDVALLAPEDVATPEEANTRVQAWIMEVIHGYEAR